MLKRLLHSGGELQGFVPGLVFGLARVLAGSMMAFGHGLGKLPPVDKFVDGVSAMGFPLPLQFAWAASLSEFAGGLLLALGLATRPAAFFIACTMATAAFLHHASDPFEVREPALLYLALSLVFLAAGGGRFSLDRRLV